MFAILYCNHIAYKSADESIVYFIVNYKICFRTKNKGLGLPVVYLMLKNPLIIQLILLFHAIDKCFHVKDWVE